MTERFHRLIECECFSSASHPDSTSIIVFLFKENDLCMVYEVVNDIFFFYKKDNYTRNYTLNDVLRLSSDDQKEIILKNIELFK